MTDKHAETAQKKALALDYANKVQQHNDQLEKTLTSEQYTFLKRYYHADDTQIYADLASALRDPDTVPSQYLAGKLSWLFDKELLDADKAIILYFADRLQEYPYAQSTYRRSFRARSNSAYSQMLTSLLQDFADVRTFMIGVSPEKILTHSLSDAEQAYLDGNAWRGCGYNSWQIAYALDMGNPTVEAAVRRILTEENGTGMMTAKLICGVLISHRNDFHALVGQLLLAARLQEGLRQMICEAADCGTKEAFLTILHVIADNDLIRFSSVKRAIGTWLGIMTEETRDLERVSAKTLRLIIDCLEDEHLREEYLASEDAMKIHTALWSLGVDDIQAAVDQIVRISREGSHHQLLVAGYFVNNLSLPHVANKIAKTVLKQHGDEEDLLAVWLPGLMSDAVYAIMNLAIRNHPIDYTVWFDSPAELDEYRLLIKHIYDQIPGKIKTFSPCVFPWYEASITKSHLAELLCAMAVLAENEERTDEVCGLIQECDSFRRQYYFSALLRRPQTPIQRRTVIESITSRDSTIGKMAYDLVLTLTLSDDEYRMVEDFLRFKSAEIRKYTMDILRRQKDCDLSACIGRLLQSKKEEVRLGGLDMLVQLQKDPKRSRIVEDFADVLRERAAAEDLSDREKLLLDTLAPQSVQRSDHAPALFTAADNYLPTEFDADYTAHCAKIFSDYFPESPLPDLICGKKTGGGLLKKIKSAITESVACASAVTAANDLLSLSRLIDDHKTDPVTNTWGETFLLGSIQHSHQLSETDGKLPLAELWQEWVQTNSITNRRLLCAMVLFLAYREKTVFSEACAASVNEVFGTGFACGKELPHAAAMEAVLNHLCRALPRDELAYLASALALWFIRCVPDRTVVVKSAFNASLPEYMNVSHLLGHEQFFFFFRRLECKNDDSLKYTFPLAVCIAEKCSSAYRKIVQKSDAPPRELSFLSSYTDEGFIYRVHNHGFGAAMELVGENAYLLAAYQGIITEAQLYAYVFSPRNLRSSLELISTAAAVYYEQGRQISGNRTRGTASLRRRLRLSLGLGDEMTDDDIRLLQFIAGVYETVLPIVLDPELSRGDTPTAYSVGIRGIVRIYGADRLARILSALGNDTLERYSWGDGSNRKGSLSHLLSVCIPSEGDSADTLRTALKGRKITAKRLIEAALFSPEWIPVVGEYLGLKSFESVCYYFMAHMNEEFDDKRKAIIARYTPLSEEELHLGAFDLNWFRSAYADIGEKDFNLIYGAAKYISDGARHSRARKYADAALGRVTVEETEKLIAQKRNKDLLMAYALIPLEGEDDICQRYLYIQHFRKESKQFGSQRAASEGKATEMALTNLAINAGYSDTVSLTLQMEVKLIDDRRALLEEQIIDGVSLRIVQGENGKAALSAAKDGKPLKSVPAKLKKNETVLAMGDLAKTLTEQYRRARTMFERAMEDSTVFRFRELWTLSAHPVVWPMLKNLVLICGDTAGFPTDGGLIDHMGTLHVLEDGAAVRIAHPFDLYRMGCWQAYQRILFANQTVQPFRQVFRELYIKTAEEMEMYHSLRYAGNQIQPAKTVGVLKSRRWVADIEDGLQKVYHKENIVAQIYALADWFSPADIEAPTLEWVCFANRKTGEAMKVADIPDILFSEVMRDVDLAVSVAHAGCVDPETSHSTMEMRGAILSFVLPMFRMDNVRVEGHHAIVHGTLAEYSIHLGSGVVHQLGGTMIPVLPVHSQHRGKIFLPFVDDDPKTAEIISKVLLFAEDGKIKDPMILANIRK